MLPSRCAVRPWKYLKLLEIKSLSLLDSSWNFDSNGTEGLKDCCGFQISHFACALQFSGPLCVCSFPASASRYSNYSSPAHHFLSTTCIRFLSSGDATERSVMANPPSSLSWIVSLPFRLIFCALLSSSSPHICRDDCNGNLMISFAIVKRCGMVNMG